MTGYNGSIDYASSLFEVKYWLRKGYKRKLLSETGIHSFQKLIEELTPESSAYISSIGKTLPEFQ